MTGFYRRVQNSTAHRPVRDSISAEVLGNPLLFAELIGIALDIKDKNHHKACWILELVLEKDITLLGSFLPAFCGTLPAFKHEGAIRSVSKICLLCVQHHIRYKGAFLSALQLQQVIDWLITDTKVASKAYAMRALYLIGKFEDWIHPELEVILRQGFPEHSPAYKGAAKEILQKISKT